MSSLNANEAPEEGGGAHFGSVAAWVGESGLSSAPRFYTLQGILYWFYRLQLGHRAVRAAVLFVPFF